MPTILCLASYFKGGPFIEECKRLGCHTILVTTQKLEHEAWPRHAIDELFMLPHANLGVQPDITHAVSYLARERRSTALWRWTTMTWRRRRTCASTCACRAWALRRRASSATSWPCACRRRGAACRCRPSRPVDQPCAPGGVHGARARPVGAQTALRGQLDGDQKGVRSRRAVGSAGNIGRPPVFLCAGEVCAGRRLSCRLGRVGGWSLRPLRTDMACRP